jgi:hypothetical protein
VLASFRTEVRLNWTAPAYLSMAPAVAALLVEGTRSASRRLAAIWRVTALTSVTIGVIATLLGFTVEAEHRLEKSTGQSAFILSTDKYNTAAELSFYTREPEEQINAFAIGEPGLAFVYWTDLEKFNGLPAIIVVNNPDEELLAQLGTYFQKLGKPERLQIHSSGNRIREVYLIDGYGYSAVPRKK